MIQLAPKILNINVSCRHCGVRAQIQANSHDIQNWQDGELIQNAMPYLSADERELLISRTCPNCWSEMFPSED